MISEREQLIKKEQELKAETVKRVNSRLKKEGKHTVRLVNFSACGFMGAKEDNKKAERTALLIAGDVQEYFDNPDKREVQFDEYGFPLPV